MKIVISLLMFFVSMGAYANCQQGTEQIKRTQNVRFYNPCAHEYLQGQIKYHAVVKCDYRQAEGYYKYQRHINYQGQLNAASGDYVVSYNQKYNWERVYNPNSYSRDYSFKLRFIPKGNDGERMDREYDCTYGWKNGQYFSECKANGAYECK